MRVIVIDSQRQEIREETINDNQVLEELQKRVGGFIERLPIPHA